ncbi:MAG: SDR family NAD(P)-dependent oxidoreductase, partial [SAR324 cluster bacterium]|nr:SDR family NAD(P)-dependent oxidoreductase [SAR324 cluster bacterium]
MNQKLSGKVALITGGARGLGRGYALHLANLGADIVIIDRNLKAADVYEFERELLSAETVMAECENLGVRAMGVEIDLCDRAVTETAVGDIIGKLGQIDIAICNAGGGTVIFADEIDAEEEALDINTTGTPANCNEEMQIRVLNNNLMTCM